MTEIERTKIFEEVHFKAHGMLGALSRTHLRNKEDQEDALQGLYIKFFLNLHKYDAGRGAKIETWLYRIAKNYFSDRISIHGTHSRHFYTCDTSEMQIAAPIPWSAEEGDEKDRLIAVIRGAVLSLESPRERAVIQLKYFDGMGCGEIGEKLGISSAAVRQLLTRTRRKILGRLGNICEGKDKKARKAGLPSEVLKAESDVKDLCEISRIF
jgi:RNA polymerase sigma factor (sigma-70 family)